MSWLQKLLPPRIKSTPGVRKTPVPEGLVGQVRVVRSDAVSHRPREEPARLPEMQLSTIASRRASASSSCWMPRAASRSASRSCRSTASSSRTRSNIRSASRSRSRKPARPTRSSSCRAACAACRWCSPRSSSISWAGRWARSSASGSCAACASPTRTACRSCASPHPAARECRKASIRCSRWRRRPPCCRS